MMQKQEARMGGAAQAAVAETSVQAGAYPCCRSAAVRPSLFGPLHHFVSPLHRCA